MSESTERAAFEADAEPMGFDLTRQSIAVPEPWAEYADEHTGHRWAGWLARASLAEGKAEPAWQTMETAPKGTEVLGWREDCGVLLVIYTSYDAFASERECDELDEQTLFQEDWFGAGVPGGFERLEGSLVPTHWKPLPPPPSMDGAVQAATSGGER